MTIKNISIETIGLHVGSNNWARGKDTGNQVPYKKTGLFTCS